MRVRHTLAVPLSLGLAALLLLAPACSVRLRSQRGRAILERATDFYRELDSTRATVEMGFRLPDGKTWAKGDTFSLAWSRPRSLSLVSPETIGAPRFVQNDEQRYAEQPFLRSYFLGDSRSLDDLLDPAKEPVREHGLPAFLVPDLSALIFGALPEVEKVDYLGSERIGGVRCRHLGLSIRGGRTEIWVARGREPWLIRYWQFLTVTRAGSPRPGTNGSPPKTNVWEYTFRDWEADPDLTGAFTFEPREGFERVDSLPSVMPSFPRPEDSSDPARGRLVSVGDPAPEVRLEPLQGEPTDLSDLRGKVVVLDFWASWCAPCIADLPRVREATGRFPEGEVVFLAVNSGEPERLVRGFLAERELDLPVALDADATVSHAFGVSSLPCLVLIDRGGTVRQVVIGSHPGAGKELRAEIERLLGE